MLNVVSPSGDVYAVFVGGIFEESAGRIVRNITEAMGTQDVSHVHLLFQSAGGFVSDGVFLHNFLKTLPIGLTVYNVGSVQSIASLVFLGACERKTSASATFMLHRTRVSPQLATASQLQVFADSAALDDARTETIWREMLNLSEEQWAIHQYNDLWLNAEQAVNAGLATSIGDFSPPTGQRVFFV